MIITLEVAQQLTDRLVAWRRAFHRHPELGFKEHKTAEAIAGELQGLGLSVRTGVAETGVVGVLEGGIGGPTVMLRFDMDALPIEEETGAEYASQASGLMHACGHDGHMAIGLGVAHLLHSIRDQIPGAVKLVFQPGEEGLGGAERMVEEGVLEDPAFDYALGIHLWNERPLGWVGITPGPIMAGAELLEIELTGVGGHGALPHMASDPLVAAAHLITALQSVVSRNVDPLEAAVITVTQASAGQAFNVIPDKVKLRGTIRTFKPEVRRAVIKRVEEIALGVAEGLGCQAAVRVQLLVPPVVNDLGLAEGFQKVARQLIPGAVIQAGVRSMVSDDVAFMMQGVPSCYILLGSNNPSRGLDAAHHNPRFDFDEAVLPHGVALLAAMTLELMRE